MTLVIFTLGVGVGLLIYAGLHLWIFGTWGGSLTGGMWDRLLHEWTVSDERGWRTVELWRISKKDFHTESTGNLYLTATDKDGNAVEPNV